MKIGSTSNAMRRFLHGMAKARQVVSKLKLRKSRMPPQKPRVEAKCWRVQR